jgi:hypothetical protein
MAMEAQMIGALKQLGAGLKAEDVARSANCSSATRQINRLTGIGAPATKFRAGGIKALNNYQAC